MGYDSDTSTTGGFQTDRATFDKNLKIIDMTDEISKTKCKTSSHALHSVAMAVGKEFEGCYWSKLSENNLKLDYPGGIAPLADCTVLLINHKDDNYESLKKAFDFVTIIAIIIVIEIIGQISITILNTNEHLVFQS